MAAYNWLDSAYRHRCRRTIVIFVALSHAFLWHFYTDSYAFGRKIATCATHSRISFQQPCSIKHINAIQLAFIIVVVLFWLWQRQAQHWNTEKNQQQKLAAATIKTHKNQPDACAHARQAQLQDSFLLFTLSAVCFVLCCAMRYVEKFAFSTHKPI